MAQAKQGSFRVDGALNPLDLSLLPENCNIVAMAPASLITNVYCSGSYYELISGVGRHERHLCLPAGMRYQPDRNQRTPH